MKKEKTTLIKPKEKKEKDKKNYNLVGSIITFVIGVILATNSKKAVIIVSYLIGCAILIIGIYHLIRYYKIKQELDYDDTGKLVIGVIGILIGLVFILLASAIEAFLRFIIGIILIVSGINKALNGINFKQYVNLIIGIIFTAIGIYTVLEENIIFALVGIILLIGSLKDIITYIAEKK